MINMIESGRLMDGVIFDVDGTLLDTMPYWHNAGARFIESLGLEPEEGLGDKLFTETAETGARYLIKTYGLDMPIEEVMAGTNGQMEEVYAEKADFKEGAKELLCRVYDLGIPITVATSTDRYMMEPALERLGIRDMFEGIFCCRELSTTKASPKIFFAAIDLMKTRAEKTWVFEDGLYAVRTAKAEGFRTVAVYDGASEADQEELARTADFYYRSLADFELLEQPDKL